MLPIILGLVGGGFLVSAFTEDKKYAKGGSVSKKQGYDDKKDESLSMQHGKIAKKDFVGTHKQKEHSRRDDAEFEEKMAKGGSTKGKFKLELYDSIEDFKGEPKETIYFENEEDARDRMDLKEDEVGKLYEMRKGKWNNFSTRIMAKGGETKKSSGTKKANPQANKLKEVIAHAKATRKDGEAWKAAVARAWKEMK